MTRREMPLVCDETMTLSLRPCRATALAQGQMLFLLGQRAAKIALHDSQAYFVGLHSRAIRRAAPPPRQAETQSAGAFSASHLASAALT